MKIDPHSSDCGPGWTFTWRDAFLALLIFVVIIAAAVYAPQLFRSFAE